MVDPLRGPPDLERNAVKKLECQGWHFKNSRVRFQAAYKQEIDLGVFVRCEGARGTVDETIEKAITNEEILQNQETIQSVEQSSFCAVPTSGSFYRRPEVERRVQKSERNPSVQQISFVFSLA
ncbi:hypothetical protein R1sor_005970 [Riccia sorocarpa]|uniref:Uncharacterized protein n=1 Tax=Riccia sorocarpa TaxID=122646 RepID=A0ABD3HPG2_9MARC